MLRRMLIGLTTALLAVTSFQAPFAHDHPDEPDHHHATGFAHVHLGLAAHPHDDEGLEIEADDDHETAVYREWTPAAAPRIEVVYVEATAPAQGAPTFVSLGVAPVIRPQSHSPPRFRLLPARAPPL